MVIILIVMKHPFTTSQIAGTIRVSKVKYSSKKMSFKKTGPSEDIKIRSR